MPLQTLLFTIPSLIYLVVHAAQGERWRELFADVGWQRGRPVYYLLAGVLILVGAGLGALAIALVPQELLQNPDVSVARYAELSPGVGSFVSVWLHEAVYVALGEEIFFRGLLGGWLMRGLGFVAGNTAQALIFLLPHLLLLRVSHTFWPLIVVQLLLGWLLGWLRFRSGSILPGFLAHSPSNAIGAMLVIG
jgi:uncharacterized protein